MKFYSEVTKKLYNSEKELINAEAAVQAEEAKRAAAEKAKKEARATRAKDVEKALKEANEAQARAIRLLKDFTRDYGYYHTSYTINDAEKAEEKKTNFSNEVNDFFDIVNTFLKY